LKIAEVTPSSKDKALDDPDNAGNLINLSLVQIITHCVTLQLGHRLIATVGGTSPDPPTLAMHNSETIPIIQIAPD
jgi:hypothetical protein